MFALTSTIWIDLDETPLTRPTIARPIILQHFSRGEPSFGGNLSSSACTFSCDIIVVLHLKSLRYTWHDASASFLGNRLFDRHTATCHSRRFYTPHWLLHTLWDRRRLLDLNGWIACIALIPFSPPQHARSNFKSLPAVWELSRISEWRWTLNGNSTCMYATCRQIGLRMIRLFERCDADSKQIDKRHT